MLSKIKTDAPETKDRLIIMSDNGTADIASIYDQDHERVIASSATGEYTVPLADLRAYAGPRGIIYTYPATHQNIEDCQRLAELEKSIVLRQITQYEKPELSDSKLDFKQVFMYIIILILIIVVAVK